MKYIYMLKQALQDGVKNVAYSQMSLKCQITSKGHTSTRLQCHAQKFTIMSNVDVGCSGFEVFSDGFQNRLP